MYALSKLLALTCAAWYSQALSVNSLSAVQPIYKKHTGKSYFQRKRLSNSYTAAGVHRAGIEAQDIVRWRGGESSLLQADQKTWNSVAECLSYFNTSVSHGLTRREANRRQQICGQNTLTPQDPKRSFIQLVIDQFDDRLSQLLVGVAVLSAVMAAVESESNGAVEPIVISLVLLINAVIGAWQSHTAERAMASIDDLQARTVLAMRDGNPYVTVNVTDLVPGDIVHLHAGDVVPCDMILTGLSGLTLGVDESSLTGESATIYKQPPSHTETGRTESNNRDNTNRGPSNRRSQGSADRKMPSGDVSRAVLYGGSLVKLGEGTGVVTATGDRTEIGKINQAIAAAKAGKAAQKTPLTKQLHKFGNQLSVGVSGICLVVWMANTKHFSSPMFPSILAGALYYLKLAIALGIAAVPEGLPSAITLCLSVGARRMAQKHVLIRKLAAVETLGSCTVICTDKTGTLTTNEMRLDRLLTIAAKADHSLEEIRSNVDGDDCVGGVPDVSVEMGGPERHTVEGKDYSYRFIEYNANELTNASRNVRDMASACLATSAVKRLQPTGSVTITSINSNTKQEEVLSGEATDVALVRFADGVTDGSDRFRRLAALPFDPVRKSSSAVVKLLSKESNSRGKDKQLLVKGAAELLLERCTSIQLDETGVGEIPDIGPESLRMGGKELGFGSQKTGLKKLKVVPLTANMRARIRAAIKQLSSHGTIETSGEFKGAMRCLAIARRDWRGDTTMAADADYKELESNLTFLGVCGITDPPRAESSLAIAQCMQAGLRVLMITGDSADTAAAVARQVGLLNSSDFSMDTVDDYIINTPDFMQWEEGRQVSVLKQPHNLVFSRARPLDKLRLVDLLKDRLGEVVAMTGDGVNDAPALHKADVGVAMGITGTEVSKGAADVVLSDDNFMSIVSAIVEGRNIYGNLMRAIQFLVSCNMAEIMIVVWAMLQGYPDMLQPLHILWINAITDGLPALAMGLRSYDESVLSNPPRRTDASILPPTTMIRHLITGAYMALASSRVFSYWFSKYGISERQLSRWSQCQQWPRFTHSFYAPNLPDNPCHVFVGGLKAIPQTMVLASVVTMELLKALGTVFTGKRNRASLRSTLDKNKALMVTVLLSFAANWMLIQRPMLGGFLGLHPLSTSEWKVVLAASLPMLFIDWILQFIIA